MNAFFHIEWWSEHDQGWEVLDSCLGALMTWELGVPGDVDGEPRHHVYNPDVLAYSPDGFGELDLWFSVELKDVEAYEAAVVTLRAYGWRVKTAGLLPREYAAADFRTFLDWLYHHDDEVVA